MSTAGLVISMLGTIVGMIVSLSVLITYRKNTRKDIEANTRKQTTQELTVSGLVERFDTFETNNTKQFNTLQTSVDTLAKSVATRDRKLDLLLWEHSHNHATALTVDTKGG